MKAPPNINDGLFISSEMPLEKKSTIKRALILNALKSQQFL
jgi:hypothetical protein